MGASVSMSVRKDRNKQAGQTVVEMALSLPLIIWLLYYVINAFYSTHTAHIGQKYAAMWLWKRVDNRAKFVMDDVANKLHDKEYMAVQFTEEDGSLPRRRIVSQAGTTLSEVAGICREPGCNR